MKLINLLLVTLCSILSFANVRADSPMLIGAGIADVTGQVTEIGFMGYAYLKQIGSGLHFRSRARAFIFVDRVSNDRMVYVSMDLCMGFELLKTVVIEKIQEKYGKTLYTKNNVIISGTHTHSAPGGMAGTILADLTILGFNKVNFDIAVTGLVNAIERAHDSLKPGRIFMGETELDDASINRSPASYLQDPEDERNLYKTNTDNTMTVLRLQGDDNTEIGAINFFPVHPVSMNESNTLSSGDNKGLASMMFENEKNPGSLPGHGKFVAAFGQANCGDVSPNTKGPICIDTGLPCDFVHSTCNGKTEMCIASGPGNDMWESTQIIAQRQYDAASKVYNSQNLVDVTSDGKITYRHSYVNFQEINVDGKYTHTGKNETTCEPAMGYSFAGGTTDGPGALDFTQGNTTGNPFWNFVSGILSKPTAEQSACHAPKPILLNVGSIKWTPLLPEWTPYILPLQISKIGELFFVAVPGEFTTMSGRRLRNTITKVLQDAGVWSANSRVLLCGLSNSYSHYIATWEEYQIQRYEGGSTLYGPHTLAAYQQEFSKLANDLALNHTSPPGPTPQDTRNITIGFVAEPPADAVPAGSSFGSVFTQPAASYKIGEVVSVVFWCASPRNDPQQDGTYLTVESVVNNVATVVMDDSAWETKFHWKRIGTNQSQCTIEFDTTGSKAGTYQIRTFGASKDASKVKTQFQGVSNTFTIA